MKILLLKDVDNLGKEGEIKEVKPGYARNYLIPKKYAVLATEENIKKLNIEKETITRKRKKEEKRLKELAKTIQGRSFTIKAKVGEDGKMFGSVTKEDISEIVSKETGIKIEKENISLFEPIKNTGVYDIELKIPPATAYMGEVNSVAVVIKLWVIEEK